MSSEVWSREPHNDIYLSSWGDLSGVDYVTLETLPSRQMWEVEEAANILVPLKLRHWKRNIAPHQEAWGTVPATDILPGGMTPSGRWLVTFYA